MKIIACLFSDEISFNLEVKKISNHMRKCAKCFHEHMADNFSTVQTNQTSILAGNFSTKG